MSGILGSIMGAASDAVGSLATLTKKGDTKQSQSAESAQAAFSSLLALAMNSKAQPAPATPTTTEGTSELADGEGDDATATGEVDGSAKGSLATVGAG
ncbi:MAG TPA: hypothetical protein VFI91_10060, partial [Longimicrobiaceae bacterium]|nr:hypothetical protein [Longimicrobiaceae bacterium]